MFSVLTLLIFLQPIRADEPLTPSNFTNDPLNNPWKTTTEEPEESPPPQKCYKIVGCFDVGKPWITPDRPSEEPMDPAKLDTHIWIQSKPSPKRKHTLYSYPNVFARKVPFDHTKSTYLITHGLRASGNNTWVAELTEGIIKRRGANVIVISWEKVSSEGFPLNYMTCVGNIRVVAREATYVLLTLMDQRQLNISTTHCIGHSLGAHICGYIGKNLTSLGYQMATVNALDLSQPFFEGYAETVRLIKGDAKLVIGHHTAAHPFVPTGGVGYIQPFADIDIYYNGGFQQPGCLVPNNFSAAGGLTEMIKDRAVGMTSCPHSRAYEYFTEAVKNQSCVFWAQKANAFNVMEGVVNTLTGGQNIDVVGLGPDCEKTEDCLPVGLDTQMFPGRGVFTISTKGSSPYCMPVGKALTTGDTLNLRTKWKQMQEKGKNLKKIFG